MDEFINEVDETLKEEKLLKFWNQYGNFIIAGVLAVVLGTAGFVGWKHYKHKSAETESVTFFDSMKLLVNKDYAGAIAGMKKISKDSSNYRELAMFREAALVIEQKNADKKPEEETVIPAEAIVLYKQIMDDKSVDQKFRNLAAVAFVMAQMDTGNPKELMTVLEANVSAVNPWAVMAKEMMAFLAIKMGDKAKAKALHEELSKNKSANQVMLAAIKSAIN